MICLNMLMPSFSAFWSYQHVSVKNWSKKAQKSIFYIKKNCTFVVLLAIT